MIAGTLALYFLLAFVSPTGDMMFVEEFNSERACAEAADGANAAIQLQIGKNARPNAVCVPIRSEV